MEHKTGCMICGQDIVYMDDTEKLTCEYCKNEFESSAKCQSGHYVCDSCHSLSARDLIEQYCINSTSEDPLNMAMVLMRNPVVKMHGPEHHFLIPAVLLSAYYNIKGGVEDKKKKIKTAKKRSEQILGGFCGFYGDCGAAVGTGIFISLITNSTPTSVEGWRQANTLTAKSLLTIANHGGPRCCKRNTYLAIKVAVKYIKKHFDVDMKINEDLKCEFNEMNKECLKEQCLFYKG